MLNQLTISNATIAPNDATHTHYSVTLSGQANGAVSFLVSRDPDVTKAVTAVSTGAWPTYGVTLPYADLWYIWAADPSGVTRECEALLPTSLIDVVAVGEAVAGILRTHQKGLEAALRQYHPSATIKYIQFGVGGDIDRYPSIIVGKPRFNAQRVGMPSTWQYDIALKIAFLTSFSSDETSELQATTAFAQTGMRLLNRMEYEQINLPSGTPIYNGCASEGEAEMAPLDDNRWAGTATILWTANALITEGA